MTHRRPQTIPRGSRWATLWSDCLAELGEPTRADVRLLERLILNLMEADKLLAVAAKKPFVSGSTGQLTEHPGFKVAARCEGVAISIARQLRLTPLARSGAGSNEKQKPEPQGFDALDQGDELAQKRQAKGA